MSCLGDPFSWSHLMPASPHDAHALTLLPDRLAAQAAVAGVRPFAVACIGSRELAAAEARALELLGGWIVARGGVVRSGGALGADSAWARGAAAVRPNRVIVCLPEDSARARARVPHGAIARTPPYPAWMWELAAAEMEFGERLLGIGLPPYAESRLAARLATASRWNYLAQAKPYVADLMVRNVAILADERTAPVDLVLGVLNPTKPGGGGTGHAFRTALAWGIPTFDLRDPAVLLAVQAALERLAQGQTLAVPRPPEPAQGDLFRGL